MRFAERLPCRLLLQIQRFCARSLILHTLRSEKKKKNCTMQYTRTCKIENLVINRY